MGSGMKIEEKLKSIGINIHVLRRVLIAIFCIIIFTGVTYVMTNVYVPNQNALGALSSVSMDVICIIILLILVCSFAFDSYEKNRTTKMYARLLIATIWAIFLDFLNWAFDGSLEAGHLTYWFTLGSLCMGSILAGLFSLYLYRYMEQMHEIKEMKKCAILCFAMNLVSFGLTFVLAITGTAFTFVDGHYEIGALYDVVTIIPILSLFIMTGYVIYHKKIIGAHDVFAAAGYICFMVTGALIESEYRIGTTYVFVAIADIFIFVMLQNGIISQEKKNVQKWMKKSKTDELTGLYNRHAYEDDIKILESSGMADDFVYVSADVNSLKATNDAKGHSAGDELLVGAAECMEACFGPFGKLYRIGGDEFIALIFANDEQLDFVKNNIAEVSDKWSGELVDSLTLSCGYVTKAEMGEMSIREMANLADKRMYEAKDEYYRRNGIERRRK